MSEIQVLDHGWVALEEQMGSDGIVVAGAKVTRGTQVADSKDSYVFYACGCRSRKEYEEKCSTHSAPCVAFVPKSSLHLITHAMRDEHNTLFEQIAYRFHVRAPIFVARQWMRHRIGTFLERSMRHCGPMDYYTPEWPSHYAHLKQMYVDEMDRQYTIYHALVADGVRKEQARGILGTAWYTEFVWVVNAWSLMNWLQKRLERKAQGEHQEYARTILSIFRATSPATAYAFCMHWGIEEVSDGKWLAVKEDDSAPF